MSTETLRIPFTGTIARHATQCTCPDTGKVGTFIFTGECHSNPGSRVSPLFDSWAELSPWLRANGWEAIGSGVLTPYRKA